MFFVLAKIAWFLLQPSSILIMSSLAAQIALWRRHVTAARRLLSVSVIIGLAALSPLPHILTLPLEQRFDRAPIDGGPIRGVIILGGAEDADTAVARGAHALNEAAERVTEAVALARTLTRAQILFSGGSGRLFPGGASEASVVYRMLTEIGVPANRIVLEDKSRDTFENAVFSRAMANPAAGERWLLVTSAAHMPRAIGSFRRAGFPVEPWPVDYRTRGWNDAGSAFYTMSDGLRRLDYVTKEYAGLFMYWISGRSSALWPGP